MIIDNTRIGVDEPPYIIAEMSGNHNGDINRALKLIEAAKEAGANAIKLQTYTPDTITLDCDGPGFVASGLWEGRRLYDLYAEAMTPWDWHPDLFSYAKELDISIFSSPFDRTAVDFLETLGAPAYKIASFEIVDIPLITYAASTGKPLIISTGLANFAEIEEALAAARATGNPHIAMLHCVSAYPAALEDCNLRTIPDMASKLGINVGLSDHSYGIEVPVAAVALGATVIEKHMTLSRADGGVDSDFSLERKEFSDMVKACRGAYNALGSANYTIKPGEEKNRSFRRSLYASENIRAGETLSADNIKSVRPGYGLHTRHYEALLGRTAREDIAFGTPLSFEMIE